MKYLGLEFNVISPPWSRNYSHKSYFNRDRERDGIGLVIIKNNSHAADDATNYRHAHEGHVLHLLMCRIPVVHERSIAWWGSESIKISSSSSSHLLFIFFERQRDNWRSLPCADEWLKTKQAELSPVGISTTSLQPFGSPEKARLHVENNCSTLPYLLASIGTQENKRQSESYTMTQRITHYEDWVCGV